MAVIGPEPEQLIDGGVILRRCHNKLSELPSLLFEGEI